MDAIPIEIRVRMKEIWLDDSGWGQLLECAKRFTHRGRALETFNLMHNNIWMLEAKCNIPLIWLDSRHKASRGRSSARQTMCSMISTGSALVIRWKVANLCLYKMSKPEVDNCIVDDLTALFTLRQSGIDSVKDINDVLYKLGLHPIHITSRESLPTI